MRTGLFCAILLLFLCCAAVAQTTSNGTANATGGYITPITFVQGSDHWLLYYGNLSTNTSARNQSFTLDSNGFSDLSDTYHLLSLSTPSTNFSYLLLTDFGHTFVSSYLSPNLTLLDSNYSVPAAQSSAYLFNDSASYSLFPFYLTPNATLSLPTLYLSGSSSSTAFHEGVMQIGSHYVFIVPYSPATGADGRAYDFQFVLPFNYSGSNTFSSYALLPAQPPSAVQSTANFSALPTDQLTNQTAANATITKTDDSGNMRYNLSIPSGTAIDTPSNYSPGLVYAADTAPVGSLDDTRIPAVLLLGPPNTTFTPNITATINYSNLSSADQAAVATSWQNNRLLIYKCDDSGNNCAYLKPYWADTTAHLLNVSIGSFSTLGLFSPDINAPAPTPSSGGSTGGGSSGSSTTGGTSLPHPRPPAPASNAPNIQIFQTPQGAEVCIGSNCYLRPAGSAENLQLLTELSCTGSICHLFGINESAFIQKYDLQPIGTVTIGPGLNTLPSPASANLFGLFNSLGPALSLKFGGLSIGPNELIFGAILGLLTAAAANLFFSRPSPPKSKRGGYG